jgi:tetratricopeptide (TPR) repeat protein
VRKAGERVRITAQLIEAEGGFHLWSETFDRRLDDIFAVQDEISAAVVDALRINLLGAPNPERSSYATGSGRTTNADAYAAYLQGLHFFNQFTSEGREKAEAKFEEALSLDPTYAPAVAMQAAVYLYQANADERGFDAGFELGRETARRAIELDPGLAAPWGTLSYIESYYDWDWDRAGQTIERLREVDSNGALSLNYVANYLAMTGRFDDAIELRQQAIKRDPLNLMFRVSQSFILIIFGDLAGAEEQLNTVLELQPGNVEAQRQLGKLRRLQGDPDAALRILEPLPRSRARTRFMASALDDLGRSEEARALMDEWFEEHSYGASFHRALFHAARGEADLAFTELDRAVDEKWRVLAYILSEPDLLGLREDPRWVNVLERIGLEEYWRRIPEKYGGPTS